MKVAAKIIAALLATTMAVAPAHAWDPYRDLTGKTLKHDVERHIDAGINSAEKFVDDPLGYIASRPQRLFSEACAAPVKYYEGALEGRAHGNWKRLPPFLANALQQHYSNNLSGVVYAENIPTANGAAQTIGNKIYFPRQINLNNPNDLHWMLHELEHTQQFNKASFGTSGKLCEYMAKAVGNGFNHDSIDMERAADRKANYLIDFALSVMNGGGGRFAQLQRPMMVSNGPQMGNVCYTPGGTLAGPYYPVGMPCWFDTPYGRFHGQVGI